MNVLCEDLRFWKEAIEAARDFFEKCENYLEVKVELEGKNRSEILALVDTDQGQVIANTYLQNRASKANFDKRTEVLFDVLSPTYIDDYSLQYEILTRLIEEIESDEFDHTPLFEEAHKERANSMEEFKLQLLYLTQRIPVAFDISDELIREVLEADEDFTSRGDWDYFVDFA